MGKEYIVKQGATTADEVVFLERESAVQTSECEITPQQVKEKRQALVNRKDELLSQLAEVNAEIVILTALYKQLQVIAKANLVTPIPGVMP